MYDNTILFLAIYNGYTAVYANSQEHTPAKNLFKCDLYIQLYSSSGYFFEIYFVIFENTKNLKPLSGHIFKQFTPLPRQNPNKPPSLYNVFTCYTKKKKWKIHTNRG